MERSPWAFKMYKQKIFQAHPLRWVGLLYPLQPKDPWNAVHGLLRIIFQAPPTALGGSSLAPQQLLIRPNTRTHLYSHAPALLIIT
jgi:hypothetical protein